MSNEKRDTYLILGILCIIAVFVLGSTAFSAPPEILRITYPIEDNRAAAGSAVAIGPNLTVSADHVIRDDVSSLGPVIAVDRKYDRCLIQGKNQTWSEVRRTPLQPGETLYFEGGTLRVQPGGALQVTQGRAVSGMSGGPIWDANGRIVSVVSEGEGAGDGRLWGYLGLAEWVDQHAAAPQPSAAAPMPDACSCEDCQCNPCKCNSQPAPQPEVVTAANTLTVYTSDTCPPCEAWKRDCAGALEAKGWNIKYAYDGGVPTPTFSYGDEAYIGYTNKGEFYTWLRAVIR